MNCGGSKPVAVVRFRARRRKERAIPHRTDHDRLVVNGPQPFRSNGPLAYPRAKKASTPAMPTIT